MSFISVLQSRRGHLLLPSHSWLAWLESCPVSGKRCPRRAWRGRRAHPSPSRAFGPHGGTGGGSGRGEPGPSENPPSRRPTVHVEGGAESDVRKRTGQRCVGGARDARERRARPCQGQYEITLKAPPREFIFAWQAVDEPLDVDLTFLIDPVAGPAGYRRTRTRGCLRVPYPPLRPTATLLPSQCNRGSLRFGRNIGRARSGAPLCCLRGGLEGEHRLRGLGENWHQRQAFFGG